MKLYIRAHDLGVKDIEPIAEKLNEYGLDGVQFVGYKCLSDVKQIPGSFTAAHAEKVAKTLKNRCFSRVHATFFFGSILLC
jgi:hypothetical protein